MSFPPVPPIDGWLVILPSGEHARYQTETFRVSVESGAVHVRRRLPHVIIEGDCDVLERAFGSGYWKEVRTIFQSRPTTALDGDA